MDMTDQPRLFRLACEAVLIQLHYVPGEGWSARANGRRQGETWDAEPTTWYSHLSAEEAADVVVAELARHLGI